MISWKMASAWVLVVVVTTVLTWQIVSLADSQVGETPVAVAPAPSTTTTVLGASSTASNTTPTSSAPTTTTPGPTTSSSTPSSTSPTSAGSTTSSTSSTSSTSEAAWSVRTINTTGGTVVVRYRPGEVDLQAATPAPGFSMEIEDSGPEKVKVEFEGNESGSQVEVRWENGSLDVKVDEED